MWTKCFQISLICSQDVLKMPSTHHKNLKDVPQISKKGFQDSSRGCQVCLQMYHKCPQNIPSYQKDVSGCPQAVSQMSKDVPKMSVILHTKSYQIRQDLNTLEVLSVFFSHFCTGFQIPTSYNQISAPQRNQG